MIIEIVQSTTGAALVIGLIILLYRLRNRFNRIVQRTIPKSKFPPPHRPNGNQTQHQYHIANQAISAPPQLTQLTTFVPSNGNNNFQNLHEMFKPQEDGMKAWPRRTQDDESKEDNHSSFLDSYTLHNWDKLSYNDSKDCSPPSANFGLAYVIIEFNKPVFKFFV